MIGNGVAKGKTKTMATRCIHRYSTFRNDIQQILNQIFQPAKMITYWMFKNDLKNRNPSHNLQGPGGGGISTLVLV